jgi:hypothetical protein
MYSRTSPIQRVTKPGIIDVEVLMNWAIDQGGNPSREYFDALLHASWTLGIDPVIMLAQSDLETDTWDSEPWRTGRNPAGLGMEKPGGYPANPNAQRWTNGTDAAYGHAAHMVAYLWGEDAPDHWPDPWPDPWAVDVRFQNPIRAGYHADTLMDLNGTWAIDPDNDYGGKIASRANRLLTIPGIINEEGIPMPEPVIVFGRVPHPPVEQRIVSNSRAWDSLGPRTIRSVAWHRMYGSLWGTDGYFRGEAVERALTDYGVGVTATDGAANDGKILLWNEPRGTRSPWANGPVSNPVGDGAAFVQRYGKAGVNRDITAIEISGTSGATPVSPKARLSIVAITAYWADQYKVSWETFPQIPSEGNRSFVIHHGEINGDKRDSCPGSVVEDITGELLRAVKARLKSYQLEGIPAPPPRPDPPPAPVIVYAPGVDAAMAARMFDSVDGEDDLTYQFNPDGPISKAWIEDGLRTQEWPAIEAVWVYPDRKYYRFKGGRTYMVGADKAVIRLGVSG